MNLRPARIPTTRPNPVLEAFRRRPLVTAWITGWAAIIVALCLAGKL